jgi:uncharacterized membrane protein (DUF485 family)
MPDDHDARLAAVAADPGYQALTQRRARMEWALTALIVAAFMGYTLLVAFAKDWLAQPLVAGGVTSIGIPIGLGLILFAILLTGFYVAYANRHFDRQMADIVARVEA